MQNFNSTIMNRINSEFNRTCYENTSCSLIQNSTMFPPQNCSLDPLWKQSDYVYFVQAVCKSDDIDLFLMGKYYLDKETVAFIVVLFDIGISFLLFFLFQYLRAMQLQTNFEITESIV
jgi:hypothetical protein